MHLANIAYGSQLQKGNLLAFVNHAFCIYIAGDAHKFSTACVCMPCAMAYTVNGIIDILDHKRIIKLQNLCVFVNVIALYMSSDQRKKRTFTILAVHCLSILSSSCRTQKIRPSNDGRKQAAFCPACALVRGSDFQAYGKYIIIASQSIKAISVIFMVGKNCVYCVKVILQQKWTIIASICYIPIKHILAKH